MLTQSFTVVTQAASPAVCKPHPDRWRADRGEVVTFEGRQLSGWEDQQRVVCRPYTDAYRRMADLAQRGGHVQILSYPVDVAEDRLARSIGPTIKVLGDLIVADGAPVRVCVDVPRERFEEAMPSPFRRLIRAVEAGGDGLSRLPNAVEFAAMLQSEAVRAAGDAIARGIRDAGDTVAEPLHRQADIAKADAYAHGAGVAVLYR